LEAWVARVASNVATDVVRRRGRAGPGPIDVPVGARDTEVVAAVVARGLLKRLPRRQREVIVLRFLVDKSEEDVAQILGISKGAVKAHTHRAMLTLQQAVAGHESAEVQP
jgi:RNA polymerase sigma factor (sigma-70 family)